MRRHDLFGNFETSSKLPADLEPVDKSLIDESHKGSTDFDEQLPANTRGRVVYVMSEALASGNASDEISFGELWGIIWRGKWLITSVTGFFIAAAIAYALLATEWYEAEILLAPAEEQATQSLAPQLGGLASLAGITIGEGGTAEPIAVLGSREFARDFIQDLKLMPVLLADEWDSNAQRWKSDDPDEQPDIRDAVRFFREDVIKIDEDSQTGLVTLRVEWTDPERAAQWASELVERLNDRMRQRALKEAEANVAYLQSQLADEHVVTIQQSIGTLLESELQKLMLARGNEEFSFRILDSAIPPKYPSSPKRVLIVLVGTLLGGVIGIFGAFVLHTRRSRQIKDDPAGR